MLSIGHQDGVEELLIRDQKFKWLCWWPGMETGLKHTGDQEECAVLDLLKASTNNFSSENELGRGGSATIYKGEICNGLEVAIKRYSEDLNGRVLEDYKTESHVVRKLQHSNIIKLLGHSIGGGNRFLVYEYMPNGSLDKFIFGRGVSLNWLSRLRIIEGIVQGLLYLHTHTVPVVHRDVKPSNILLDSDMNAKIGDFGIAIMLNSGQQERCLALQGTYGYMAPEYVIQGILSTKVDVYAFGITLLEIIAAKRWFHICSQWNDLPSYAWNLWTTGRSVELLYPSLLIEPPTAEVMVMKCVQIALLCVQSDPADRPTMSDVYVMLTSENISLPDPEHPSFYRAREENLSDDCASDYASEATWSSADLTWPR